MPDHPLIVVHVAGCVIQEIEADSTVRVLVLDYDTDGIDDSALSGPPGARAVVSDWPVTANPVRIATVVNQYIKEGGEDDGTAAAPGLSG